MQASSAVILGNGYSVGVYPANWLYFGVEQFNRFDKKPSDQDGEVVAAITRQENIESDFETTQYFLRIFPFKSSFFFQYGQVQRDWSLEYAGSGTLGDDTVNQTAYRFTAEMPDKAINTGLGLSWIFKNGFSGGVTYGWINSDKAVVTDYYVSNPTISQADVDKEIARIESDAILDNMSKISYLAFYLGWNF